jgi:thymidylate synthase (FAD)
MKNEYKVLNYGFVRLVDVMGDDNAIVQAARVSYGKGTKSHSEDRSLIRYLMRHRHTSPFEMVEFKFHIKLPIFVARQWIRHRTANVNEYSGRYSEMKDEFYIPEAEQIRLQSTTNKQGRSEEHFSEELTETFSERIVNSQEMAFNEYSQFLESGMARELARINLPLSIYTEWYWKIDLHNLFHFLRLRFDGHAQYEIRVYAEVIANILKEIVPLAYEAFEDYTLNAITLSADEKKLVLKYLDMDAIKQASHTEYGMSKNEFNEFLGKLTEC